MAVDMTMPRIIAGRTSSVLDRQRLDGLAHRVLGRIAPLSFEIAQTPADIDAVLRMRYDCVIEMGWAEPKDYPDGRERDAFDDEAVHVIGRDGSAIVGCMRLIFPTAGRDLPTERDFGIQVDPRGDAFEGGRIIVPRKHRAARSHLVLAGLFARAWLTARVHSFERAISTATPQMIALYRALGMRIIVLGPSRSYWGEERAPIEIGGAEDSFALLDPLRHDAAAG